MFYNLSHLPLLPSTYLTEAMSAEYQQPKVEVNNERTPRTVRSRSSFGNTQFVKDLTSKFEVVNSFYLKFDPNTCYDWHTDRNRSCAVNFLLNDVGNGLTLFRTYQSRLNYSITECKYELGRPMLLDTTVEHCVLNWSTQTRYVLSLAIHEKFYFNEVKEFLLNYHTDQY